MLNESLTWLYLLKYSWTSTPIYMGLIIGINVIRARDHKNSINQELCFEF
jgi:hypothetical protein